MFEQNLNIVKVDIFLLRKKIQMENIKCFTDASYSKEIEVSVIGYKVGDAQIILKHLPQIKNTQAELYAVDKCI